MKAISLLVLAHALFLTPATPAQQQDPATAWPAFLAANGSGWTAEWNPATDTPNAIGLPFDLKVLGAPGCVLLASGEAVFPVTTSSVGTASLSFAIPNITSLVGLVFFNQYLVTDSTNAFGIVFSNGGQ